MQIASFLNGGGCLFFSVPGSILILIILYVNIIAMTANAFDEDIRNDRKAGMDGHLSIPIEVDKLVQEIRSVLEIICWIFLSN